MPIAKISGLHGPQWAILEPGTDTLPKEAHCASTLADLLAGEAVHAEIEADATLVAPLDPGARVLCIGLNYRAHAAETGHAEPKYPVVFTRTQDSLVGPGEAMIKPAESEKMDYEGELAIVIGQGGRRIPQDKAMEAIAGYTILNDGSIRDFQSHTSQFAPGKNFDRSGAIGPWIATAEEAGAPDKLHMTTTLNGEVVQDSGVDDLIFSVPELVAYVSTFMELRTGDIIATGTPSGVGMARNPTKFLQDGDTVVIDIPGVGTLTNSVEAD